jgi:hypothetical protein
MCATVDDHDPPSRVTRSLWLCLPACAALLLAAVTNELCEDTASFPLLWVLPLYFYLLSFVLCFYYTENSGVGLALRALADRPTRHIGVVGLGTGSLAAWGRAGDSLRFYEIDPGIVDVARRWFTYLADCPAQVDVVLGDARLSLEREPPQHFDLLVLDAFSSDAIPVHLLTEEAFGIYWRHVKADGIIAVHVSNRRLDLEPVVQRVAERFQAASVWIQTDDDAAGQPASSWVLVTKVRDLLDQPAIRARASVPDADDIGSWTDDYADLLAVLDLNAASSSVVFIDPTEEGDGTAGQERRAQLGGGR